MNRVTQEELHRHILARVEKIPAASAVVLEIIRRTSGEDYDFREIANLISKDPALALKVMRLANSAYFGLPYRVEKLSSAVSLMGVKAVRRIVITASTYDVMKARLKGYGLERGSLWSHSLAVSTTVSRLCGIAGCEDEEEELRVAALFHDVGKIALSPVFTERGDGAVTPVLEGGGVDAVDLELAVCGIDHAEISAIVAENWNLPPRFVKMLRYHHWPGIVPDEPRAISFINLSDRICRNLFETGDPAEATRGLDPAAVEAVDLDCELVESRAAGLYADILEELAYWTS